MSPYLSDKGMGFLYENSEILSQVNPHLDGYYEYDASGTESRTQRDHTEVLERAERLFPAGTNPKLFEVGYGSGVFLLGAAGRGWQVDGIDTSGENSRKLAEERGMKVRHGSFSEFTPPRGGYQLVALWDVIEHTIDPRQFVRKAFEMLDPGGLLMLATPNIGGLLNTFSEMLYRITFGKVRFAVQKLYVLEHVGYFDPATLKRLVEAEGFEFQEQFLTETDLDRYRFSPFLKPFLKIFFALARVLKKENRLVLFARKPL